MIEDDDWRHEFEDFFKELSISPVAETPWTIYDCSRDCKHLEDDIRLALYGNKELHIDVKPNLVRIIAKRCVEKTYFKSEDGYIVHLAVIYVCVRVKKSEPELVVPIFRVMDRIDEPPQNCWIVDQSGREYSGYSTYLENNGWGKNCIIIPNQAQYKLVNGKCELYGSSSSDVHTGDVESTTLTKRKILASMQLMKSNHEHEIAKIMDKLDKKHHRTFEACRQAKVTETLSET